MTCCRGELGGPGKLREHKVGAGRDARGQVGWRVGLGGEAEPQAWG